jgi:adenine-specific DNA-methyltransferase
LDQTPDLHDLTREQLVELLQERTEKSEGGVKIQFAGKSNARQLARKVRPRVQRSVKKYSAGDAEAQSNNLVIEGDNLQAMVTLFRERGQVDLIITDPPYNTGQDFRYNDKWDDDPNDPGLGELVSEDEAAKHTKWMRFMLPRLKMMHSMLKPTGVLAICIDHRELFHLGQMLDELFDDKNRIGIINWQKSYSPRNDNKHLSTATEYVLVYAKDIERATTALIPRTEANNSRYVNVDDDPKGVWREHDLSAATPSRQQQYGIQSPLTGKMYYPAGTRSWTHPKRNIKRWLEEWGLKYEERDIKDGRVKALMVVGAEPDHLPDGAAKKTKQRLKAGNWPFIWFGLKGTGGPRVKRYLEDVKKGIVPMTYWADEDYDEPLTIGCTSWDHEESGRSQTGIKELNAVVGSGHGFETVKPLQLFQKIIQLWCRPDGLVLDPFGGSGTTGHAVLGLNHTTGSDRRFIVIEQGRPERGDSYARTLLFDRLSRVVTGDWANGKGLPLGGGFRFVTLDKKVDADALLAMEREEMIDTVLASYYDTSRRRASNLVPVDPLEYRYLVARNNDKEGFFLIWEGPDKNTDFTEDVYEACSEEARRAELKPNYHVYARFNLFQTENVRFYQIPNRILVDFGLDERNDAFTEDDK